MNESELITLLERSSHGMVPDVETLVAGGRIRGRLHLRRRRIAGGLGIAAAVGALAVGTTLLPSGGSSPTRVTDASVAASPPASPAPRKLADLEVIKDRLITALPDGDVSDVTMTEGTKRRPVVPTITFTLDDVEVQAEMHHSPVLKLSDIPDPGPAPQHCTAEILNRDGHPEADLRDPEFRDCAEWRAASKRYECGAECVDLANTPVCARPVERNTMPDPTCTKLPDGSWVYTNDFPHPGEKLDSLLTWATIDAYDRWHFTLSADQPGVEGVDTPLLDQDTLLAIVESDIWFK